MSHFSTSRAQSFKDTGAASILSVVPALRLIVEGNPPSWHCASQIQKMANIQGKLPLVTLILENFTSWKHSSPFRHNIVTDQEEFSAAHRYGQTEHQSRSSSPYS